MDQNDLAWIRARTRHAAKLYDRFRLDHVVGYFRMFVRPPAAEGQAKPNKGCFDPSVEAQQNARGERVLRAIQAEAGATRVIGEDLGVIPPFVRKTLTTLGIPGYRVLPWEADSGIFRDPARFPVSSVATWSTHDTAPIVSWWDELPAADRAELAKLASLDDQAARDPEGRWLPLMRLLLRSASELTLVLPQEILGESSRVNTPGTVGEGNWTYRLPRVIEDLSADPAVVLRMRALRELVRESGR
jgi:4-alpha-glucanotransferase